MNMNRVFLDMNVVQNLALSPSLWLVPSMMIILKDPIAGYNNKFKTATRSMVFGVNGDLNYHKPSVVPKMAQQPGGSHLDNLEKPHDKPSKVFAEDIPSKVLVKPVKKDPVVVSKTEYSYRMCHQQISVVIWISLFYEYEAEGADQTTQTTKIYADAYVSEKQGLQGGAMNGELNMGNNDLTGVQVQPVSISSETSKFYVDAQVGGKHKRHRSDTPTVS